MDLGSRRIGVATSDASGALASPLEVVIRSGDPVLDHAAIRRLAEETGAERIVVGLPLSLDGREGPAAAAMRAEAEQLAVVVDVPVELFDERLTTVSAHRALAQRGLNSHARRNVVDKAAAAVMLQAWLDGRPR
ncbi:MAG TPA: Holliday junction resolvase RuvX [Acidimicrobiales bacterium]|nr:Holliday junction resolvase RuvX [Acidimicrobiales bacterium]